MKRILLLPEMYGLPRELPNESKLRNHRKIGNFKKICKVVLVNCKKKKIISEILNSKTNFFLFSRICMQDFVRQSEKTHFCF